MKKFLGVAMWAVCAYAQSIAGHWNVSMDTPHGPMQGSLDFQQDGSKITGKLELGPMGTFDLKGTVKSPSVVFQVDLPDNAGTIKFTGTIDGGKITGTTDPHEFKWEASRAVVGTLIEFRSRPVAFGLKPDSGPAIYFQVSPETQVLKIPPGERDLQKAAPATVTDLAIGDRLMVSFVAGMTEARRIVRVSPGDIARRNDAERLDWQQRGISGIVTETSGDAIIVEVRSAQGKQTVRLAVGAATKIRRYAPDSVKFADARASTLGEISAGDQLRARGTKSEDGSQIAADDIVFGTFLTVAGAIIAVDANAGEVQIRDLATKAPRTIRLTADSRVRRMPDLREMFGHAANQTPPPAAPSDIAQMIEALPACNIENLKIGTTLVASATRGEHGNSVTAILLVANVDALVEMARAQAGNKGLSPLEAMASMHHGLMDGPGGFTLPGILQ